MKAKINYKSKKTIIIIAIAAILLVAAIVGTVAFIKGNQEAAAAMTGDEEISTPVDNENNGGLTGSDTQNSGDEQENPQIPTVGDENNQTTVEDGNAIANENGGNADNTTNNGTANNAGTTTGTTASTVPNQEYTQTTTQITEQPWETTLIGWTPITVSASTVNLGINKAELQKIKLVYVGNDSLDKAPVTTVAQKGDELTYVIKVINASEIDANNIKIYDSIPEGTEYVEDSISDNGTIEDGDLSWKIDIAKGETKTVSFKVTVLSEEFSVIDNTAKVDGGDTNEVHTPIITKYKTSELVIKDENGVETVEDRDAKIGETIRYKINVVNISEYAGTTPVYDIVPEGTTLVEGSISNEGVVETTIDENGIETNKIVWDNVHIAANDTTTVSFDVTVNEKKINPETLLEEYVTVVKNKAVVGNNETNEVVDKVIDPEIYVKKTIISVTSLDSEGESVTEEIEQDDESQANVNVKAGDIVGYQITVTNIGNIPLNHITLKDVMENGGKVYFDKDLTQKANTIVDYYDELTLQAGEETTYTVYYKITDTDRENVEENPSLTNTVTAEGYFDVPDENGNPVQNPDPVTDDDTADVNFEREPDISIVKEQYLDDTKLETNEITIKVKPGQVINYKITIKNTGNTNLTNVDFTDVMNEDLLGNIREVENIKATVNGEERNYTENDGSYRLNGTLEVGDVLVITAKYTVAEEADMSADQENIITNKAVVDTEETTPKGSTVSIQTVEWETIFDISKTGYLKDDDGKYTIDANGKEVKAKDTIKYVLTVENSGKKPGTYTVQDQDLKTLVENQYVTAPTTVTVKDYKADGTAQTRTVSADENKTIVEKLYDGIDVYVTGENSATVEFEVTVTANVKPGQKITNTVGEDTVINNVTKDIVVKSNVGSITDANYILLIDSSSSMVNNTLSNGDTRLAAAKKAIKDLVKLLFENNPNTKSKISIVQFNATAEIVTVEDQKVFGIEDFSLNANGNLTGTINTLINNITSVKGTNIEAGLRKTGELLYDTETGIHAQNLTTNKKDVIILLSDGNPNSGTTDPEDLGEIAQAQLARKGSGIVNEIYGISFVNGDSTEALNKIANNKVYKSTNRATLYKAFNEAVYAAGGNNSVTLKQESQVIYTGDKQIAADKKITITYKGLAKAKEYTFTTTGTSSDGALVYSKNEDGTYSLTFNLIDEFIDKEEIVITYYVK